MGMSDYVRVFRQRWITIVVVMLIALGTVGAASYFATPVYKATASTYFYLPIGNSAGDLSQGSTYTQAQMQSYAALTTKPVVLEPVIERFGIDQSARQFAGRVEATASADTVILEITVADTSAQRAADLANAVAAELGMTARRLAPKNQKGESGVDVETVGTASAPSGAVSPQTRRNLMAALLAGILAGCSIAVLRDRLDTRVRTPEEVTRIVGAPVLGTIAQDRVFSRRRLVVRDLPRSPLAESYRTLRSNVGFLDVDHRPLSVVVTSSLPGEGKTSTAINLAFTSAEAEQRVLLIDADLRRPSVADYLGLEGAAGLTTVLAGRARFEDVVQPLGLDTSFDVLTSGVTPPNPSELLGSERMAELLRGISGRYDVIVFDSPPLLPVTDAPVLARQTTGAVLVASATKVRRRQLTQSAEILERVGARLLGVVLTRVPTAESSAYYGYASDEAGEPAHRGGTEGADVQAHRERLDDPVDHSPGPKSRE